MKILGRNQKLELRKPRLKAETPKEIILLIISIIPKFRVR